NGWIRVFDPAYPGSPANPDTSRAFATGIVVGLRDLKVDAAGSLYYLAGDGGVIHKISFSTVLGDAGFEVPSAGPARVSGSFLYGPTGTPWAFAGSAGVTANGSGFTSANPAAPEGAQVAFLQGQGSMSQAVSWQAGTYVVGFYAAQRGGAQAEDFEVLI